MRFLAPNDWPTIGSIVKRLKTSGKVPFPAVQLPEPTIANPDILLPGQNAGFMGREWDPEIFRCDPSAAEFHVDGSGLQADISLQRLSIRNSGCCCG
jgi:hypothetical protein